MNIKHGWKVFWTTINNPVLRAVFNQLDKLIERAEDTYEGSNKGALKLLQVRNWIEQIVEAAGVARTYIEPFWPLIKAAIDRYVAKKNASGEFKL